LGFVDFECLAGFAIPDGALTMNVSLTDELKEFVRRKIENGQFRSEEAVIEAALKRLRDLEGDGRKSRPTLDDFIDHEFVEYCARESDDNVTLEEVLEGTSTIKQSMASAIIEEERAERF
jgi:putative addiction module CopG family antidote